MPSFSLAVGKRGGAGILPEYLIEIADGRVVQSRCDVRDTEIRVVQKILRTLDLNPVDHMDIEMPHFLVKLREKS